MITASEVEKHIRETQMNVSQLFFNPVIRTWRRCTKMSTIRVSALTWVVTHSPTLRVTQRGKNFLINLVKVPGPNQQSPPKFYRKSRRWEVAMRHQRWCSLKSIGQLRRNSRITCHKPHRRHPRSRHRTTYTTAISISSSKQTLRRISTGAITRTGRLASKLSKKRRSYFNTSIIQCWRATTQNTTSTQEKEPSKLLGTSIRRNESSRLSTKHQVPSSLRTSLNSKIKRART